jgi:hypothetical protein
VDWLFGDHAEPGAPSMPGLALLASVEAVCDDGAPSPPPPPLLDPPLARGLRPRRPLSLGHREQPPPGARCHLRRGRRPEPHRQRPPKTSPSSAA